MARTHARTHTRTRAQDLGVGATPAAEKKRSRWDETPAALGGGGGGGAYGATPAAAGGMFGATPAFTPGMVAGEGRLAQSAGGGWLRPPPHPTGPHRNPAPGRVWHAPA
jgi:hypothetical protein